MRFDTDYLPTTMLVRSPQPRVLSGDLIEVKDERGNWVRARVERQVGKVLWLTRQHEDTRKPRYIM